MQQCAGGLNSWFNVKAFACKEPVRLQRANGGRGAGTEQNKPLSRQSEQEARKEGGLSPGGRLANHWDCDKTATQLLQRPPIVRASNTDTHAQKQHTCAEMEKKSRGGSTE